MFSWLKYYIRQYFGFSRGQTHGVVVLLLFLGIALAIPRIIHYYDICEQRRDALQSAAVLDALVKDFEHTNLSKQDYVSRQPSLKKVFFDINAACEDDLKRLYEIGPVRAKRIIAYRDSLGGFVHTTQYHEVCNLPADVIDRLQQHTFIKSDFVPQKIALNKASLQTLARHPYLTYSQAKAIIAYKNQHGVFDKAKDVEKVKCVSASVIKKLLPYLVVTN